MRALLLVLVALLGAGCKKANGLIVVTVESRAALPTAVLLHATVTAAGHMGDFDLGAASSMPIAFPKTFGVYIEPQYAGRVTIAVNALNAARDIVASGMTTTTAIAGTESSATVSLGGGVEPDLGSDLGTTMIVDGGVDACMARSCSDAALVCGKTSDGCNGTLDCGPCQVTALHEPMAHVGDTIFIEGLFNADVIVTFPGGATAQPTVLGANRASVVVPAGATSGALTITSASVQSAPTPFRLATFPLALQPFRPASQTLTARESPTLNLPRLSHASTQIGRFLYVVGGASTNYLGDVRRAIINADATLGNFSDAGAQLSTPRSGHVLLATANFLYVVGGFGQAGTAGLERAPINADGTLGSFVSITTGNLTTPRGDFTSAIIGNYLYVFGGDGGGSTYLNSIERARINGDSTIGPFADAGTQMTAARSGAIATVAGNFVYVMGGVANFGYKNSIERAPIHPDGTLGQFTDTGQTLMKKRAYAAGIKLGSTFFVVGGFDGSVARADAEALTFTATLLTGIAPATPVLATGRSGQTAEIIGDAALIIGGYGTASLGDVERADTAQTAAMNAATTIASTLKYPGSEVAGAVISDSWYLFGGADGTGTATTNVQRAPIAPDGSVGAFVDGGVALKVARVGATTATIGGYVYVLGGGVNSIERAPINLDGSLGVFADAGVATMTARRDATTLIIGETLYLIGGKGPAGALATLEKSSIDTMGNLGTFTSAGQLQNARMQHSSALLNNQVWVFGGTSDGSTPVAATESSTYSAGQLGAFANVNATTIATPRFGALLFGIGGSLFLSAGSTASGPITTNGIEQAPVDLQGNVSAFVALGSNLAQPRVNGAGALIANQIVSAAGNPTASRSSVEAATLH